MVVFEVPAHGVGAGVVTGLGSSLRRRRTRSTVAAGVAFGVVCGRRERGSKAASPSAS